MESINNNENNSDNDSTGGLKILKFKKINTEDFDDGVDDDDGNNNKKPKGNGTVSVSISMEKNNKNEIEMKENCFDSAKTTTMKTTTTTEGKNEFSSKNISIAWNNLRFDHPNDQQSINNKKNLFNFKYFLLLHRRGSVATPPVINNSNSNSTSSSSTSPDQRPKYPVLRRLTGFFEYQSINGLLGPSSHARKTFLQCLTGFMSCGLSTDSSIYLNSNEMKPGVAWVPKNLKETIFPRMFVSEILRYAFLFQNGFVSWNKIKAHINSILSDLLLSDCQILQKRFEQCSLDEQRRIVIAQQLMSIKSPISFLFLDEPFSELDSWSSQKIMQSLKQIIQKYRLTIVISASNVPNAYLLHFFDKLYILAHGGVCIYSGPPKSLAQALRPESNNNPNNNDDSNLYDKPPPIEEMLKISCLEFTHAQVRKLADRTLADEHRKVFPYLDQLRYRSRGSSISPKKCFHLVDFLLHLFRQFRLLLINHWFLWRLLFTILFHVFLWYFLVDKQMTDAHGCYDPISKHLVRPINKTRTTCEQVVQEQFNIDNYVTYQMYSMWFLASMATTSTGIAGYRMLRVFQNEHQNRHYSLGVFILSTTIVQLVTSIFWSLLSTLLVYWLSTVNDLSNIFDVNFWSPGGSNNLQRFLHVWLFYWLLYLYHQSYGSLISTIVYYKHSPLLLIITISQVIVLIFQLFNNNILVIVDRINFWLFRSIGNHFICLRYLYDGVFHSFYGLGRCDVYLEANYHHHYDLDHLENSSINSSSSSSPASSTSSFFVKSIMFQRYSIQEHPTTAIILKNFLPIVILILVIRLLAIIILWFRFHLNHDSCPSMDRERKHNVNNNNNSTNEPIVEMIPIDYGMNGSLRKKARVRIIQPIFKDDDEVEFCRDKIHLAWRSLSLFATAISTSSSGNTSVAGHSDLILRNLNGQFSLGTMNAVIGGQSKSTRTSLLRVFSGHLKTRICPGTLFYESQYTNTNTCFISRDSDEYFIPGLTVKQSIIYASIIKNIEEDIDGRLDHEEMALNIMDELNLGHLAANLVHECSRHDQKRLALAQELTSLLMPNFICMDDPTDRLDVISSELLVRCIRDLSERHSITFVASFHQTQHQVLSMFDQLYCLTKNGCCIYSGPPTSDSILKHLQSANESLIINTYPLEILLKYSCIDDASVVSTTMLDKMIQNNNRKVLQLDSLLPEDTISLSNGIKSNVITFSVIAVKRLCKRYQARWIASLWFHWIIYTAIYLLIGLILNGFFGSETTKPDGCIRMDIFNGTHSCPQHRTGTKMIWDEDGHLLWDNYRYIHLANHLFLLFVLFHTSFVFYRELKIFLNQHQNGWFSSGVFYLNHNLLIDICPMIPVVMIYLYIIDYNPHDDHLEVVSENSQQYSSRAIYWWSVILMLIAMKSIQSISHLVVIIFGHNRNRYELSMNVLLIISALLFITSNFHIRNRFTLSFLNVFKYLDEAILVLIYGAKYQRCSSVPIPTHHQYHTQKYVSLILHRMDIIDANVHFNHCLKILLCQTFIFRWLSWFALLFRVNADRIFKHHRLWSSNSEELPSSPLPFSSTDAEADLPTTSSSIEPFTGPSSSLNFSSTSSPNNSSSSDHLDFRKIS